VSSSLMALPDWQMSILSNASSAALREHPRWLIFHVLSVVLLLTLPRLSMCLSLVFLTVLILGDASDSTEGTEEQRAIVD